MKKWLTLAVATLVIGCTEEVTQWTPELDLDAPNAQLAEAPPTAPDLSAEMTALQAQIAALEAKLAEQPSNAALLDELKKLQELLAKLLEPEKPFEPLVVLPLEVLPGMFELLHPIVTGTGIVVNKNSTSDSSYPVGTTIMSEFASNAAVPTKDFQSVFDHQGTCFTLCPVGTAPYSRTLVEKTYTLEFQDGNKSGAKKKYPVWHCGTIDADGVQHNKVAEAKIICGGEPMDLKDTVFFGQETLFGEIEYAYNTEVNTRRSFLAPGAKSDYEEASCPGTLGITGLVLGAADHSLQLGYSGLGIAHFQCGKAQTLVPANEVNMVKNSFYGTTILTHVFDANADQILHCPEGYYLSGWLRRPNRIDSVPMMALCRKVPEPE